MAKLNRAAFSREDLDDAKRGFPEFDLRGYAAERGLEFLDHGTPAGFRGVVPGKEEVQHNVLRGVLPGGAYGVIAHEGLEIEYSGDSLDWGGTFYGLRVTAKSEDSGLVTALSFLPFIGWLFGSSATANVRVPCTVAGARVPEAAGTLTSLRIDKRRSAPPHSFGNRIKLGPHTGLGDWSVFGDPQPGPDLLARLIAEPIEGLLRQHTREPLFQIVVWYGTLLVRRNGYLRPEQLDELGQAVSAVAAHLREICLLLAEPQRFDVHLPAPAWRREDAEIPPGFNLLTPWRQWAVEHAERYRMELEEAQAYHRAFPSVPIPGMASVVLRGTLPQIGERGRLVVHRERESSRPAVLLEASADAEPTPPGGVVYPEQGVRLEVRDGLMAVWSITSYWGNHMAGDVDAFCAKAATVLSEARRSPATR